MGEPKVGKTSFMNSSAGGEVPEEYIQTIGLDFWVITRQLELYKQTYTIKVHMWDWSGDK